MPLSVRTRFEVFKRDEFTCRYCGRKSPDVVLQVDHIIPVALGGGDDEMNLVTSCWECNSGKAAVPLNEMITGEDPHDKAVELLERERQLSEYNAVLRRERARRENTAWDLAYYWLHEQGRLTPAQIAGEEEFSCNRGDIGWLRGAVKWCPEEQIKEFMDLAITRGHTRNLKWVAACCRNWRNDLEASTEIS